MLCARCGFTNAEGATTCRVCDSDLGNFDRTVERRLSVDGADDTAVATPPPKSLSDWKRDRLRVSGELTPGFEIGNRYRVMKPLGRGGMGMVYLAYDKDLQRQVALKLILPELGEDPFILERFRREILLSSRVTHPNVLRVYDLGETDGVKFLTMEYVDGEDLADVIGKGERLPVERIVAIFRQICAGLSAAHAIGVMHRDLKPQNIMVDKTGRALLSDFGLAKTAQQTNLTVSGAVLGTPYYMSPEQVKGQEVDHRSDIYSLGIILYEMLAGDVPFTGNSAYEIMMKRVQQAPRPITELNAGTPAWLVKILNKLLQVDPDRRYQTLDDVIADLDRAGAKPVKQAPAALRWALPAAICVLLAIIVGIVLWQPRQPAAPPAAHKPVSVLISDFKNGTGEPVFDGTLEPIVTLALEGAPFINSYNRAQAHKTATQIQPDSTSMDERLARLVAVREGLDVVIAGEIKRGGSYDLTLLALDGATGKTIGQTKVSAESKEQVLAAVGRAAAELRKALGDTTPVAAQIAAAETFTAGSLDAAHEYAIGQDFFWRGKFDDAAKHYDAAIKLDPNLGRAYAGLATVYANTGRKDDAENYYKQALSHIDRMTDREKFRTRSAYYLLTRNNARAIDELTQLVRQYPADMAGLNNLPLAYFYTRDMRRAMEESKKVISAYPKNFVARNNAALYAMYAGDFADAITQAQTVMRMNPSYAKAYVAIALSQLAQNDTQAARATYEQLAKVSASGASMANAGLADADLVQGDSREASSRLHAGVEKDRSAQRNDPANRKLATLASIDADAAIAEQILAGGGHDQHVIYTAARALLLAKKEQRALAAAARLTAELEPELQHYGRLIEGEALLQRGNAREALAKFDEAAKLADSWLLRFDRGQAYLALNAFTEAESDFDACVKRKGEATAVFLDDVPTFHYFPPALYYLGRARESLGSKNAAESYKQFLAIKTKGDGDPLVADARRRVGTAK